jgi:hypothetical protein
MSTGSAPGSSSGTPSTASLISAHPSRKRNSPVGGVRPSHDARAIPDLWDLRLCPCRTAGRRISKCPGTCVRSSSKTVNGPVDTVYTHTICTLTWRNASLICDSSRKRSARASYSCIHSRQRRLGSSSRLHVSKRRTARFWRLPSRWATPAPQPPECEGWRDQLISLGFGHR